MTAVMLAAYPEVFAAGAIIAGLPYGAAATVQTAFETMAQLATKAGVEGKGRFLIHAPLLTMTKGMTVPASRPAPATPPDRRSAVPPR